MNQIIIQNLTKVKPQRGSQDEGGNVAGAGQDRQSRLLNKYFLNQ